MKKFLNNILKTFFGNIVSLTIGILLGFFIPKMIGKDRDQLNPETIRYYLHRYYIKIVLLFCVSLAMCLTLVDAESQFIVVALCFTIISSQTVGVH